MGLLEVIFLSIQIFWAFCFFSGTLSPFHIPSLFALCPWFFYCTYHNSQKLTAAIGSVRAAMIFTRNNERLHPTPVKESSSEGGWFEELGSVRVLFVTNGTHKLNLQAMVWIFKLDWVLQTHPNVLAEGRWENKIVAEHSKRKKYPITNVDFSKKKN